MVGVAAGKGDTLVADFFSTMGKSEALGARSLWKCLDISKEALSLQLQRVRHKNLYIYSKRLPPCSLNWADQDKNGGGKLGLRTQSMAPKESITFNQNHSIKPKITVTYSNHKLEIIIAIEIVFYGLIKNPLNNIEIMWIPNFVNPTFMQSICFNSYVSI